MRAISVSQTLVTAVPTTPGNVPYPPPTLEPMTWPCLLACVPSAMWRCRPETRSSTSTQSPPAQMSSCPRTRMEVSVRSAPATPSGSPAARASSVRGVTPRPSTTTSAGYSADSVATARTRPDPAVRTLVTSAPVTTRIPERSIASVTRRPMSGSSECMGSGPRVSSVTSKPRASIASAISMPM